MIPESPQDGRVTVLLPQNSSVNPQNPNLEQQTFNGQFSTWEYIELLYPGLQYALLSHPATQTSFAQSIHQGLA
jgi:hypothetical protein